MTSDKPIPTTVPTTPPKPNPVPAVGDTVLFHHRIDDALWPAMVLEVTVESGPETVPPAGSIRCYLQVFRPRGNDWLRAVDGTNPGTWKVKP